MSLRNKTLRAEAQEFLLRLLSGEATQDDALAIRRWRQISPDHEAAFREIARVTALVRAAAAELVAERTATLAAVQRSRIPRFSRRRVLQGALAASTGGIALLVASKSGFMPLSGKQADFETSKGETRHVVLGTGLSIELNTLTRIALRPEFGPEAFEVLSGEIIATAMQSAIGPLVAIAAGGLTRAREARFAVRCDGESVAVSCLEGSVEVELAGATARLSAGQGSRYSGESLGPISGVDPAVVEGWRSGMLLFRDERLDRVIAEINRYRPGRILLVSRTLAERRVNAVFYLDRIDQVVDQIRLAYGAQITHLPGGVVLAG